MIVILLFSLGLLSLIIGAVILVRKEYFLYGRKGAFIGKVSGRKAKSNGITNIAAGLFFLGWSIVIYLWGD